MSEIEQRASEVVDYAPFTPVSIERAIFTMKLRIDEAVEYHRGVYAAKLEAESAYKAAHGAATLGHGGTAAEKKAHADVETIELRRAWDEARVVERHTTESLRSLRGELITLMSMSKNVASAYMADRGFGR